MTRIKEREAARVVSAVGGQGHSVRSDCRGKCDSKRCKCVKEGVYCSSKCHRGNACCENHEALLALVFVIVDNSCALH